MAPKLFSFGRDPWDPSRRFETSWLLTPTVLGVARLFIAIYAFCVQFFSLGWVCEHAELGGCVEARHEFSYFTVLTYWGLAFYFGASAVHTLTYAFKGQPLLDRWPRPLQALHSLLYSSVVVYPFIVTVIYWAVIYGGDGFQGQYGTWSNVSRHALNSVFALLEIALPRTEPMPWVHVLWLILVLALYLALAYLTRATSGFYVYTFLDPQRTGSGMVAAYVAGIGVGCLVVFGLARGLVWLRRWATETRSERVAREEGGAAADVEMGERLSSVEAAK